jgi:hypothetical protein
MHFVAGDAREFSAAKTGRRLHPIELSAGHANHSIAPESFDEKIRLGAADEILLFAVIRRVWLHDETLSEIVSARAETGAVPIKIDLVRHVVEGPDAVALTTDKR